MNAIVVEGVSKTYRQYTDEPLFMAMLRPNLRRERTFVDALRNVSFEVERGSTLGIIGQNGSGKTTLLRLLSGVSAPTQGRLRIDGTIAPLIGVGVGFNQELTGRENVEVNGRLLGMTSEQVRERFDAIVDFAEIEEFIDAPVKFYSSGMFLRLAFAVAIHTDPDVMLIDEILAVGDVGFQAKCFDRMRTLQQSGTTIVIVTHNLQMLERLTTRTLVLEHGDVVHDGNTEKALDVYHTLLQQRRDEHDYRGAPSWEDRIVAAETPMAQVGAALVDDDGNEVVQVQAHESATIRAHVTFDREVTGPIVGFSIERAGIGVLYMGGSAPDAYQETHGPERPLSCSFQLSALPLLGGTHVLRVVVRDPSSHAQLGSSRPKLFHVTSTGLGAGSVDLAPTIEVEGQQVPLSRPYLLETERRGLD